MALTGGRSLTPDDAVSANGRSHHKDKVPESGAELVTRANLGYVHSCETFGLADGPGVRYVAAMQGCRMRCQYCHNPETWDVSKGASCSVEDLFAKAWRYHNYWSNNGGVTVSGGEPLLQIEFVSDFFGLLKEHDIHTAVDTAGGPFIDDPAFLRKFEKLAEVTDLFIVDMKEADPVKHKALTGWDNANIFGMMQWLSDHGKEMWVRHVLVPGVTDDESGLRLLREKLDAFDTISRVQVLPYTIMAELKWEKMGMAYPLDGVPEPTPEQIAKAEEILRAG